MILTIDVGSSSVRAGLYDRNAQLCEGLNARRGYEFQTTADGGAEVDADFLFELVCQVIDEVFAKGIGNPEEIDAVAVSTFWHNVLGVDKDQCPLTPVYSWADTRSAEAAEELKQQLNEESVHSRTGTVLHPSYWPAKLRWLRQSRPDLWERTKKWMSFGEYLYLKLFGETICGISMASGTGLLDQVRCAWDEEILRTLSLSPEQLSPLGDLDTPLQQLRSPYIQRWPRLKDVPWLPALGDGACSNIGSGCVDSKRIALMVGTSGAMRISLDRAPSFIPRGLWCYHIDRRRFLIGGALSNGGILFEWLRDTIRLEANSELLEQELSAMGPAAHGLTVLPFLLGERSPGWRGQARAAFVGLNLHTRPIEILRASLESVACRFAKIASLLKPVAPESVEIVASGGALLNSPAWTQIMADVLGRPVIASAVTEASSRGAALLALETTKRIFACGQVVHPLGRVYLPNPENQPVYEKMRMRQDELYELLINQFGP
ncbi:MAG: gluconokinase [Terriglobia bacterium]